MAEKLDWDKLTEVQLKGSLVRRGLSTDGTKEEMITRLKNYSMDESHVLSRHKMIYGYYASKGLRTVLITPFKKELMANQAFVSALDKTTSYQIQKSKVGKSAVKLVFSSVDEGDAEYFQLTSKLASLNVEVLHPASPSMKSEVTDEINKILKGSTTYSEKLLKRTVLLEKLPSSINKEQKLCELFPEAVDTVSFQFDSSSSGNAILEFASEAEVDEFIKTSGKEMELEGETVSVSKYHTPRSEHNKSKTAEKKSEDKEESGPLEDEERIALNEELHALEEELLTMVDNKDMSGQQKLQRLCDIKEIRKNKQTRLNADTRRRLLAKETELPEGERILKSTEQIIKANNQPKPSPKKDTPKKTSGQSDQSSKGKSPAKSSSKGNSKKKAAKVVSMKKGFSGKSRPNSAPARVQNRNQMGHGQFVNNYARNAQSGVPGGQLLPDQRQTLVRGRGMNRNMQPGMPGSFGQLGYNSRPGQQKYPQQMRGQQYGDKQAQMIVEGLTNVLTEKVRELEHMQNLQQQGQSQFRGPQPGRYDNRNMPMDRGYDGRHMSHMDQERYLLEEFYQGGSDIGMGYSMDLHQSPANMRGVYEERAPYTNFRGRGMPMGRSYPRAGQYESGGGYGRGNNW